MPLCSLLNTDDPIFDFEHAMAHREVLAVMAPLSNYSAIPYFIEPWPLPFPPYPDPATDWRLDHQQAHNDFSSAMPGYFLAEHVGFGIPDNQNLLENDLNNEASRTWWTFANHQEHFIASGVISPLPGTLPTGAAPGWWSDVTVNYPFW